MLRSPHPGYPLRAALLLPLLLTACSDGIAMSLLPETGAVAADHESASRAGARMFALGGNAVDAAVAAALSSGVVQPAGSGLGGGGFALVVQPTGETTFLDFREVAPAAVTPEMLLIKGASRTGGLAVAVPAEGIGLADLQARFGRLPHATVVAPAVDQAYYGFDAQEHLLSALAEHPTMGMLFAKSNDGLSKRPALMKALKAWGETGGRAFREGWVAKDFVAATTAAGGVLSLDDLRNYTVVERQALRGEWRGYTVVTAPPPSSGGVALLQMLAATEGVFGLPCRVEAAKFAMADRSTFGGDPGFVTVNTAALLAPERIASIRSDCGSSTFPPDHYGKVATVIDHGTMHVSVIDGHGMAVALTSTINTTFGSEVITRGSGIVLNNQMDDFTTRPGEPNAFGLVQGENNAVGPGRRPLSSMSPTVVLDEAGKPVLSLGASGGPFIITATYQVLESVLLSGKSVHEAVSAPRWHHQWLPDTVMVEPAETRNAEFAGAGHTVTPLARPFSAVQAVHVRAEGLLDAASDPRKGGEAVIVKSPGAPPEVTEPSR